MMDVPAVMGEEKLMSELSAYIAEQNRGRLIKSDALVISVRVGIPDMVQLQIESFGASPESERSKEHLEWWRASQWVDTFHEMSLWGRVSYPEPFAGKSVQIDINHLGRIDHISDPINRKMLGDGWYDKSRFLFRLSLPLAATEALLSHVRQNLPNPAERDQLPVSLGLSILILHDAEDRTSYSVSHLKTYAS